MLLQGAMRGKQAPKRGRLAQACQGDSPEACRALRGKWPLPSLACEVSQSHRNGHGSGQKEDPRHRGEMSMVPEGNLPDPLE
jgi:hypothetical protein